MKMQHFASLRAFCVNAAVSFCGYISFCGLPHSAGVHDPGPSPKSCQRVGSQLALTSNLCTIVQGCRYKGYLWRW